MPSARRPAATRPRPTINRALEGTTPLAAVSQNAAASRPSAVVEIDMVNPVTKSGDVQGRPVFGRQGAKLGTVRELYVDLAAGTLDFVIVEGASLLGGSGKYHPVPWAAIRYDPVAASFQIEATKDEFKASPSYDREQLANPSYGWEEQSIRHFTTAASGPAVGG